MNESEVKEKRKLAERTRRPPIPRIVYFAGIVCLKSFSSLMMQIKEHSGLAEERDFREFQTREDRFSTEAREVTVLCAKVNACKIKQ